MSEATLVPERYELFRDSHNRICADIDGTLNIGIKILGETDAKRVEKGIHAYVVLTIKLPIGVLRFRDINIMWSRRDEQHFVRWPSWQTGRFKGNGKPEYLDRLGPLDPESREEYDGAILDLFDQVREEAQKGTLPGYGTRREQEASAGEETPSSE